MINIVSKVSIRWLAPSITDYTAPLLKLQEVSPKTLLILINLLDSVIHIRVVVEARTSETKTETLVAETKTETEAI